MVAISALDALLNEEQRPSITTNAIQLDKLLLGGISLGSVTEICGMHGVGKTQLCMQLCVNVQIPKRCGGLGGIPIYLDTEGSVKGSRLESIANATVERLNNESEANLNTRAILSNIKLYRLLSLADLLELIDELDTQLSQNPNIKLVVIDSIAFHFRSFVGNLQERTRILNSLSQKLRRIASVYEVAVVITNQMTMNVKDTRNRGTSMLPALGESWGHACTHRLILFRQKEGRMAWLAKSSTAEEGLAPFDIASEGIVDREVD